MQWPQFRKGLTDPRANKSFFHAVCLVPLAANLEHCLIHLGNSFKTEECTIYQFVTTQVDETQTARESSNESCIPPAKQIVLEHSYGKDVQPATVISKKQSYQEHSYSKSQIFIGTENTAQVEEIITNV